jgi:hypothetical protein
MKKVVGFVVILVLLSLALQACQMSVPSFLATPTPTMTSTPRPTATRTLTPTRTPYPSITPNMRATREADDMTALVEKYKADGYIASAEGKYYKLDDFQENFAEIYYYMWYGIEDRKGDLIPATDFVMRSDVSWDSASDTPNESGCGFVFRNDSERNHYAVFLLTTGNTIAWINLDKVKRLGTKRFGSPQVKGQANLTIVVVDEKIHVFVDDQFIKTYMGARSFTGGNHLAFSINSGTNKSYGTRCTFRNTFLYVLKE